jgi:hypothetical protein
MSLTDTPIPSLQTAPPGARPSVIGRRLRVQVQRRTLMRFVAGAGLTLGATVAGLLPGARRAEAGWMSTYSYWPNCSGIYDSGTTCYPPYYDVSSSHCNGAGFHRDDSWSGTCANYHYYVDTTACDGKNAWLWTDTRKRCSDGSYTYSTCSGSGTTKSICRASY